MGMVRNGYSQSGHGTLKLTLLQGDEINWLFACCYKFRKTKSCFNDFWMGMIKNGCGLLVHETQKICCILRFNLWIELQIVVQKFLWYLLYIFDFQMPGVHRSCSCWYFKAKANGLTSSQNNYEIMGGFNLDQRQR